MITDEYRSNQSTKDAHNNTFLLWNFNGCDFLFENSTAGCLLAQGIASDSKNILFFSADAILLGSIFCAVALTNVKINMQQKQE